MRNKFVRFKYVYVLLIIICIVIGAVLSTYAFLVATASGSDDIGTSSTSYDISMKINPLYDGFSFIPMDDGNALKALSNNCKDKFGRGACNAYTINIYGYDDNLGNISGVMDVNLDNIENLSYMVLEDSSEYNANSCIVIEDKTYCISKEATRVLDGVNLSLGDSYDITSSKDKNFILLIWLTNLEYSQNERDIGNFNATITFSMGNGGEIKGSIDGVLKNDSDKLQSEE